MHRILMAVVLILIGMIFAGWLRGLPLLNKLPQY